MNERFVATFTSEIWNLNENFVQVFETKNDFPLSTNLNFLDYFKYQQPNCVTINCHLEQIINRRHEWIANHHLKQIIDHHHKPIANCPPKKFGQQGIRQIGQRGSQRPNLQSFVVALPPGKLRRAKIAMQKLWMKIHRLPSSTVLVEDGNVTTGVHVEWFLASTGDSGKKLVQSPFLKQKIWKRPRVDQFRDTVPTRDHIMPVFKWNSTLCKAMLFWITTTFSSYTIKPDKLIHPRTNNAVIFWKITH